MNSSQFPFFFLGRIAWEQLPALGFYLSGKQQLISVFSFFRINIFAAPPVAAAVYVVVGCADLQWLLFSDFPAFPHVRKSQ